MTGNDRALLHGTLDATCRGRRNCKRGERAMDEPDCRNLTDAVDGFFKSKRYLIHDRDPLDTREFLSMLVEVGIESVELPPRSPNLNVHAERFVRTIKESCLERMILFGEDSLRNAVREFLAHYAERNHQGLKNRLITPTEISVNTEAPIHRRERLGGMLNYYYREAA